MKTPTIAGLVCAAFALSSLNCEAHVLVYRVQLAGKFVSEDAQGISKSRTYPSTYSGLWLFDLDTDYWVESSSAGTSAESITLIEQPKTAKSAAVKSFFHAPDDGSENGKHRVAHKFEFYSNSKKFYYFYFQTEDYGNWGFDTGSILAQGSCKSGVNIGGGLRSPVPADFTGALVRGDGNTLKKGVLSFKYDATITSAVNDYLEANSIESVKGSGTSTAIPAATTWLIDVYLPKTYKLVDAPQ